VRHPQGHHKKTLHDVAMATGGVLPRVLVVDDDEAIRVALERALRLEGFAVSLVPGGVAALESVEREPPDVVVLDIAMPDLDGVEVAKRLRARGIAVPVLVLSARDEVDDRVAGLQAGADDYLVKPFALRELVARLHALLRRTPGGPRVPLRVSDLALDPARHLARRGDRELDLTRREFELLEAFAEHPGIVLSRRQLLSRVWGYDFEVDGNVVDVFVGYLRRKLEAAGEPRLLHTVRGVGFVLRA
jgi:DNA-binding response OmpR family regulator